MKDVNEKQIERFTSNMKKMDNDYKAIVIAFAQGVEAMQKVYKSNDKQAKA